MTHTPPTCPLHFQVENGLAFTREDSVLFQAQLLKGPEDVCGGAAGTGLGALVGQLGGSRQVVSLGSEIPDFRFTSQCCTDKGSLSNRGHCFLSMKKVQPLTRISGKTRVPFGVLLMSYV